MARSERESKSRRREVADLLVLPRPAKSVQNGTVFSRKNLNIMSLPNRKEWPSAKERAVSKYARSTFAKRKRNRAVSRDHEIVRWE